VRETMGLEEEGGDGEGKLGEWSLAKNRIIASFRDVGEALGRGYTLRK
jgi:hypothetical protein